MSGRESEPVESGLGIDAVRCSAAEGRVALFERIVEENEAVIYRFLCVTMGEPETARDILQETFMKAYLALPRARPDTNYRNWLYTIARNTARDEFRRRKRRVRLVHRDDLEAENGPVRADEDGVLARETLRTALASLEPVTAQCVVMVAQGLTYDEIARITRISAGAVRARVHRARESLRESMKEERW